MYCIYFLLQLIHMSRIFVFNTEFYFKFSKVRLAFLYKPSARYLNKLHIILWNGNVLSIRIRIIFILYSIIAKYKIKIREWQASAMNTVLRSPLQVCTRIYKYLLNLPAIYLSDLGWGILRMASHTVYVFLREREIQSQYIGGILSLQLPRQFQKQ